MSFFEIFKAHHIMEKHAPKHNSQNNIIKYIVYKFEKSVQILDVGLHWDLKTQSNFSHPVFELLL